jgi:hypothetical protein
MIRYSQYLSKINTKNYSGFKLISFFYQNANHIYYLIIKFEISYKKNRIIKRKLVDFYIYRNHFPSVNKIEYHVINFQKPISGVENTDNPKIDEPEIN